MKFKGTWIFLAIVFTAVGFTVWDIEREKRAEQEKLEANILIPYKSEHIQNIVIETPEQKIELDKTVDGWKMLSPLEDWADNASVEEFIASLVSQKSIKHVASGDQTNLSIYGLKPSAGSVRVSHQDKSNITWEIGRKKSYEGSSYLKKAGGQDVLLANSEWSNWLIKKPFEFRDRRLLRGKIGAVSYIEVKNSKGLTVLNKKNNKWIAPKNPKLFIDPNRVQEFLTQLGEVKADEIPVEKTVTSADKKKYNLEPAKISLVLVVGEKKWTADIGNNKLETYAYVSNPTFILKLNNIVFDRFKNTKLSTFRDKKEPFVFNRELVKKIEMRSALKRQTLIFKDNQWSLSTPDPKAEVQQPQVAALLEALKNMTVAEYTDGAIPLKIENRIILKDQDGKDVYEFAWSGLIKRKIDDIEKNIVTARTSTTREAFYMDQSEVDKMNLQQIIKYKNETNSN